MSEKKFAYKLEAKQSWSLTAAQGVIGLIKEIEGALITENDSYNLIIIEASRLLAKELGEVEGLKTIFSIDIVK